MRAEHGWTWTNESGGHCCQGRLDLVTEDPARPCNIHYGRPSLCVDQAGADIIKPLQLARLETKVRPPVIPGQLRALQKDITRFLHIRRLLQYFVFMRISEPT